MMPTFNQLVRKGREKCGEEGQGSGSLKGWNSKKRAADRSEFSPEARRVHGR